MNILWASNYTTFSAYSQQARMIVPALVRMGHNLTVLNLSNGTAMPQVVDGIQVLPIARDALGNDVLAYYAQQTNADAVITLVDPHGIAPDAAKSVPYFPYAPIDHNPIPPRTLETLKAARQPIATSRFGFRQMTSAGLRPLYAPHVFDPDVFYPETKADARRALGLRDDTFIVSFVGVNHDNPSRKGIAELLEAWRVFAQRHKNALLYLHTSAHGNTHLDARGGVNIPLLIAMLDIRPETVRIVDQGQYYQGIPADALRTWYSASDWFVLPSRGEGFGVPLIEAQACGCPVVTSKFAAGEELSASKLYIYGDSEWSPHNSFRLAPRVSSIIDALETAYANREDDSYRIHAIAFARSYEKDRVMDTYWRVVLATLEKAA